MEAHRLREKNEDHNQLTRFFLTDLLRMDDRIRRMCLTTFTTLTFVVKTFTFTISPMKFEEDKMAIAVYGIGCPLFWGTLSL
jgi:hypothetical protein